MKKLIPLVIIALAFASCSKPNPMEFLFIGENVSVDENLVLIKEEIGEEDYNLLVKYIAYGLDDDLFAMTYQAILEKAQRSRDMQNDLKEYVDVKFVGLELVVDKEGFLFEDTVIDGKHIIVEDFNSYYEGDVNKKYIFEIKNKTSKDIEYFGFHLLLNHINGNRVTEYIRFGKSVIPANQTVTGIFYDEVYSEDKRSRDVSMEGIEVEGAHLSLINFTDGSSSIDD